MMVRSSLLSVVWGDPSPSGRHVAGQCPASAASSPCLPALSAWEAGGFHRSNDKLKKLEERKHVWCLSALHTPGCILLWVSGVCEPPMWSLGC